MKAISLTQPWASLVVYGEKRIETRSWRTDYRGPLLIHAAKLFPEALRDLCRTEPFSSALRQREGRIPFSSDSLGAIIGWVTLVDVVATPTSGPKHPWLPPPEPELSFGDYSPGRYAWLLKNHFCFETPIPYRGALGLFEVPDDVAKEVP